MVMTLNYRKYLITFMQMNHFIVTFIFQIETEVEGQKFDHRYIIFFD